MKENQTIFEDNSLTTYELTPAQQLKIQDAIGILESRLSSKGGFTSPLEVKQFCQLNIAQEKDEYFCCLFLDNQHRLIAFERLFRGTIDGASVYPRVVVRRSLELNSAAVIFTHNHPSGSPEPSTSDINITKRLKEALALIDVRVLDHVVAGTAGTVSMVEAGLI